MVTLVDDHVAVSRNEIFHLSLADQALEHRDIQEAVWLLLPSTDLTDVLRLDAEKLLELAFPLIKQRLTVNEDECASCPCSDEVGSHHGLPHTWRGDENSVVIVQQRSNGLLLHRGQLPVELVLERLAVVLLVVDHQTDVVFVQQGL